MRSNPGGAVMARRAADDQAAREDRLAAIQDCPRCDEWGWCLGADGLAADTATRCGHGTTNRPAFRDITGPLHEQQTRP